MILAWQRKTMCYKQGCERFSFPGLGPGKRVCQSLSDLHFHRKVSKEKSRICRVSVEWLIPKNVSFEVGEECEFLTQWSGNYRAPLPPNAL